MSTINYYKDNLTITTTTTTITTTIESQSCETKIVPTKLYVTNFPQNCTRRQLTEFFSDFGKVLECAIMWDSYAFIHYASHDEAYSALKQARGKRFMGNKLIIQLSTSRNRQDSNWYQREATKLHNQLFPMQSTPYSSETNDKNKLILSCIENSDTQNSSSKSSISSNSMLNVTETKLYVTNLPDECNKDDLKLHFEKHGNVLECVIMWNHYAFVHFASPIEARYALEQTHGKVYRDRNLIVQLSTSSNRPLPKCIALNKNKEKSDKTKFNFNNFELDNSIIQQSSSFYESFEKNTKIERHPPTILCYRASDLENELKNKLNLNNSECFTDCTTLNTDATINAFDKHKYENLINLSFSEIPTPELSNVPIKKCIPQISKHIKTEIDFLKELMNKKNGDQDLPNKLKAKSTMTLDDVPTPPRPNKSCFQKLVDDIRMNQQDLTINGSIYGIKQQQECPKFEFNETKTTIANDKKCSRSPSSSSSLSIRSISSEYSESSSVCSSSSTSSSSSSPYSTCEDSVYGTKSTKPDKVDDNNEEITKQPKEQISEKQQTQANNNKLLRSRCRIVNYLLYQENA